MDQAAPIWLTYTLEFKGRDADKHYLEAHPAGHSIEGFSWALALTLNYGVTGRTRYSRDLSRSARILISPPKRGSVLFELNILVQENPFLAITAGGYAVNTVTPYINGLISYVFGQALGLGTEFAEDAKQYLKKLNGDDLNTISRRIEPPLTRAHKVIGRTADEVVFKSRRATLATLDEITKENLNAQPSGKYDTIDTNVTSFNVLTGNGRLYDPEAETTIPFSLQKTTRHGTATALILSMDQYSLGRNGTIRIVAERVETNSGRATNSGRLTKYIVSSAEEIPLSDWVGGVDPLRTKRQ
ncbi:hypothetical protein [Leisingera thetidis]|uniref:DUF7946 domain-containing protein n=1 Tax=Leisingera thetidis TaxID=2930199 RepID=UPI0021F72085|nr:hypothetical protein [Leisingera thetidis]